MLVELCEITSALRPKGPKRVALFVRYESSTKIIFNFYHPFALPEEAAMYEVNS